MKRKDLTKGMRVGIARGRDWRQYSVAEAYVLDVDHTYSRVDSFFRNHQPEQTFDDPLNPGQTVTGHMRKMREGEPGGQIAILQKAVYSGEEWHVATVPLAQIVGDYEWAAAEVAKTRDATRDADRMRRERDQANRDAFAQLKADYPKLDVWMVTMEVSSARVTLPLALLRELLEGAAQ